MSAALAWAATAAWAVAALAATPAALWLRLRDGRRDAGAWILVLFLAAQLVGLGALEVTASEIRVEGSGSGFPPWLAWMVGVAGLGALAAAPRQEGASGRAAALAFGLFGTGHLLRALALAVATAPA